MFTSKTTYRVPYADTDQMKYMYYGHYPKLYEMGRAEMVRDLGITYRELEAIHKISMPVLEINCRYKKPALYDQLLTIESTLTEMPTKLICFHHRVFNEENELLNKGFVKLFFIDQQLNKRISAPTVLTEKLIPYFG